jgi:hypothetical protein
MQVLFLGELYTGECRIMHREQIIPTNGYAKIIAV